MVRQKCRSRDEGQKKKLLKKVILLLFQKVSTSFYTIRHLYIKSEEEGELQSPTLPVPSLRGL